MRILPHLPTGALAAVLLICTGLPVRAAITITVDKSTQQMIVEVDGQPRYRWPVSTGISKFATPSGAYTAFRMEKDHFSKEWDDAPMPNSIFFTKRGHAIHGYLNTKNIGMPASHGCVRLEPQNAELLFTLVKEHGVLNTKVVIAGDERIAARRGKLPSQAQRIPGAYQNTQQEQVARAPALPEPQDIRPQPYVRGYADQRYPQQQYQQQQYQQDYAQRDFYGRPRYRDPRYYDPRYDAPEYSPYYRRPQGYYPPFFQGN